MTYIKGRPRGPLPGAIGGFDPLSSIKNLLTPKPVEMPEDFVGNVNALPICPYTDGSGWCRKYVGGQAVKMAVNVKPLAQPKSPTTSTSSGPSLISTLISTLTTPAKLPTAPGPVAQPQGMTSTTKLALAGGAVLLVAIVASRR